jgi:dihydrofolate synthase/folylpolyglutamate synthase
MDLGLERVAQVAHTLALLPVEQPVVTVAGTNGKGSAVAVLEGVLSELGYRTGVFTSPHLLQFNERIRVDSSDVPDADIVAAFAAIDDARGQISLTYFEFSLLAALLVFKQSKPDILVLEVGLGGRLDAVNIVDCSIAIITSIALDHQEWLGDSLDAIAREKAGILRAQKPVVVAEAVPVPALLDSIAEAGAAPAYFPGRDIVLSSDTREWRSTLRQRDGQQRRIGPFELGALVPENICAALQAALLLGADFSDAQLARALASCAPTGRRQLRTAGGKLYVLDVAHNLASVHKLLEYLNVTPCSGKTLGLFSVMADKDTQGIVDVAAGCFDAWFLADQPGNARAAAARDVAALLNAAGQTMISVSKNLRQALRRAQTVMSPGDRLVVFGSFYTVAAVLPLLHTDPHNNEAR